MINSRQETRFGSSKVWSKKKKKINTGTTTATATTPPPQQSLTHYPNTVGKRKEKRKFEKHFQTFTLIALAAVPNDTFALC